MIVLRIVTKETGTENNKIITIFFFLIYHSWHGSQNSNLRTEMRSITHPKQNYFKFHTLGPGIFFKLNADSSVLFVRVAF